MLLISQDWGSYPECSVLTVNSSSRGAPKVTVINVIIPVMQWVEINLKSQVCDLISRYMNFIWFSQRNLFLDQHPGKSEGKTARAMNGAGIWLDWLVSDELDLFPVSSSYTHTHTHTLLILSALLTAKADQPIHICHAFDFHLLLSVSVTHMLLSRLRREDGPSYASVLIDHWSLSEKHLL